MFTKIASSEVLTLRDKIKRLQILASNLSGCDKAVTVTQIKEAKWELDKLLVKERKKDKKPAPVIEMKTHQNNTAALVSSGKF